MGLKMKGRNLLPWSAFELVESFFAGTLNFADY
jgi:hypothetical protein